METIQALCKYDYDHPSHEDFSYWRWRYNTDGGQLWFFSCLLILLCITISIGQLTVLLRIGTYFAKSYEGVSQLTASTITDKMCGITGFDSDSCSSLFSAGSICTTEVRDPHFAGFYYDSNVNPNNGSTCMSCLDYFTMQISCNECVWPIGINEYCVSVVCTPITNWYVNDLFGLPIIIATVIGALTQALQDVTLFELVIINFHPPLTLMTVWEDILMQAIHFVSYVQYYFVGTFVLYGSVLTMVVSAGILTLLSNAVVLVFLTTFGQLFLQVVFTSSKSTTMISNKLQIATTSDVSTQLTQRRLVYFIINTVWVILFLVAVVVAPCTVYTSSVIILTLVFFCNMGTVAPELIIFRHSLEYIDVYFPYAWKFTELWIMTLLPTAAMVLCVNISDGAAFAGNRFIFELGNILITHHFGWVVGIVLCMLVDIIISVINGKIAKYSNTFLFWASGCCLSSFVCALILVIYMSYGFEFLMYRDMTPVVSFSMHDQLLNHFNQFPVQELIKRLFACVGFYILFGLPRVIYIFCVDTEPLPPTSDGQSKDTPNILPSPHEIEVQVSHYYRSWVRRCLRNIRIHTHIYTKGYSITKRSPQRTKLYGFYYISMLFCVVAVCISSSKFGNGHRLH